MLGGEAERVAGTHRHPDHHGPVRVRRFEDREGIGDVLRIGVRGTLLRSVGPPVAPSVERHDPEQAREIRDLELPVPRVE